MITLENLKEIQLFNRYNNDIYLKQLSTNPIQYKLCGKFNYMRYGKDENSENISFIDPEGGPQIFVPSLIYGTKYTVESIVFDDDKSEYLIHLTK
jgi:hypothetical protein